MASDISSGCNEAFDDEKEEGEISLEDVSSSEEGPPYRYPARAFGQCPHCLSMQRCHMWCRSLPVNKYNLKREAPAYYVAKDTGAGGLQGKENRHHCYYKDPLVTEVSASSLAGITLQEKNDDEESYSKISSDTDMELVGLGLDKTPKRNRKLRKKRRKKSPTTLTLALALKESIHHQELLSKKEKNKRHSAEKKKSISSKSSASTHRHKKSGASKRRSKTPPRKTSPLRPHKLVKKLPLHIEDSKPVQESSRGEVTKLLKKVRKLDSETSRSKEKGSSLKDKLSNIIKNKKDETPATLIANIVKENESSIKPDVKEELEFDCLPSTKQKKEIGIKDEEKKVTVVEEKKPENFEKIPEEDEDVIIVRQVVRENKQKTSDASDEIKLEALDRFSPPPISPLPPPDAQKLPNFCMDDNDEDLELRMEALRSAVIKKHRTRMQRNKRHQKSFDESQDLMPKIESPFTSTFIEDFPLLAKICNPESPSNGKKDIICSEDMDLDSDMDLDIEDESPYSPSDNIIEHVMLSNNICSENQGSSVGKQTANLSLYSPSKPTETPVNLKLHRKPQEAALDDSIFESRPYSPSDDTTYDPDLPGVFSNSTAPLFHTAGTTVIPLVPPPLPPMEPPPLPPMEPPPPLPPLEPPMPPPLPPMPPLNLLTPQSLMLGCQASIMNMFMDPMVSTGFTIHQAINPSLLSASTPMFAFPATVATTSSNSINLGANNNLPMNVTTSEPPLIETISSVPDDIMETDLDGSPLVSMEKDSHRHNNWPPLEEPLYLQNALEKSQFERNGMPTPLVPISVLKNNKQLQKQPIKKLMTQPPQKNKLFKSLDMIPVSKDNLKVKSTLFQPMKLQYVPKMKINMLPAEAFDSCTEDENDKEKIFDKEEERVKRDMLSDRIKRRKLRKSVTPSPIDRRKRAKSIRPSESLSRRKSRLSRESSVSRRLRRIESRQKDENKLKDSKANNHIENQNVDDDEDTLRAILLESLAKNKRERTLKKVENVINLKTSTENNSKATGSILNVIDLPIKIDNNNLKTSVTTPIIIDKNKETINLLKRPATTELPLADHPSLKVARKANTISISTKVVNNAKRFQNLLLQRKQKLLLAKSRFKVINNKVIDQSSDSPNVNKSSTKSRRIIINLNEDTESESESESEVSPKTSPVKDRPALAIPTSDFEKSLDHFLKNARLQHEKSVAKSPANTKEASPKAITPTVSALPTISTSPLVADKKIVTPPISKVITSTETSPSKDVISLSAQLNKSATPSVSLPNIIITTSAPLLNNSVTISAPSLDKVVASHACKITTLSTTPPANKVTTKTFISPLNKDAAPFIPSSIKVTAATALAISNNSAALTSAISKITIPLKTSKVTTMVTLPTSRAISSVLTSSPMVTTSTMKKVNISPITKSITATTSIYTTAAVATNLTKDKIGTNITQSSNSGRQISSLSATPQAVKHLPAPQQEEYHRLKQQLYEKLYLQEKAKEMAAATNTTLITTSFAPTVSQITDTQMVIGNLSKTPPISTTPVISTVSVKSTVSVTSTAPVMSTAAVTSSSPATSTTPATLTVPVILTVPSSSSLTPLLVTSSILKDVSKTVRAVASSTKSSKSVINVVAKSKTPEPNGKRPIVITPTKIINSTSSLSQNQNILNNLHTATSIITNKINKLASNINVTGTSPNVTPPLTRKNSAAEEKKNKQQVMLLDKMTNALNNQVLQISAAAQKVSSLRILTKEQINNKGILQSIIKSENGTIMDNRIKVEQSVPEVTVKREPIENDVDMKIVKTEENSNIMNVSVNIENTSPLNISIDSVKNEPLDITNEIVASLKEEPTSNESYIPINNIKTELPNIVDNRPSIESVQEENNHPSEVSSNIIRTNQTWDDFKQGVNDEVQSLISLSTKEQKKLLIKAEENLVTKRHAVLDDVTEMSANLRQWEVERDMQNILTIEVRKLRQQLKIVEEKLQQQKNKLNSIQPKVSLSQEKINDGRKECFRLSKICSGLGQQIVGPNYKVPTACAELLSNRIKEVATHTQKLKSKRLQSDTTKKINLRKTDGMKSKKLNNSNVAELNCNSDNSSMNTMEPSISNIQLNSDDIGATENESATITSQCTSVQSVNNVSNNQIQVTDMSDENLSLTMISTVQNEKQNMTTSIQNSNSNLQNINETKKSLINENAIKTNTKNYLNQINVDNTNLTEKKSTNTSYNQQSLNMTKIQRSMSKTNEPKTTLNDENMEVEFICSSKPRTRFNGTNSFKVIDISSSEESENALHHSNYENSVLTTSDNTDNKESFHTANLQNIPVIIENIELEPTNFLHESSNTKNKNLSEEISVDNTIILDKTITENKSKNTSVKQNLGIQKDTNIKIFETTAENTSASDNSILIMEHKKSLEETDNTKLNSNVNNKESEMLSTNKMANVTGSKSLTTENQPSNSTKSLNAEDIERKSLTEFVEIFEKANYSGNDNSNTPLFTNEHSTLMEEIDLIELANAEEMTQVINFQPTIENTHVSQCQDKISNFQTSLRNSSKKKKKVIRPYESILKHFNGPRNNKTDGILCPFELMGTCNDEDCQFVHQSTSHRR